MITGIEIEDSRTELNGGLAFSLGEVHQEEIEAADMVARLLLASNEPRCQVNLKTSNGQKAQGFVFRKGLIVTDEFIAIINSQDQIDRFLPRR